MTAIHAMRLSMAIGLFVATVGLFSQAIHPFLEPWRAGSFAATEAEARGIGEWRLDSKTDDGGGHFRFIYENPTDSRSFADMTVARQGNEWCVTHFNKDFRPWDAKPTR